MKKALKVSTWVFMIIAVIFFWLGLRSTAGNFEYTLYALGAIVIAWITNYVLRKHEKKDKEEDGDLS